MESCMSKAPQSKKPRSLTVPSSPPVVTDSDFDVVRTEHFQDLPLPRVARFTRAWIETK